MGRAEVTSQVSGLSIRMSAAFSVLGVSLLYLYIAISTVPETVKILWAGGLSIVIAVVFLIVWTLTRDLSKVRN